MPSTTVHIPDQLLSKIDQTVREQNISRNRFIVQACEKALEKGAGKWPRAFFQKKVPDEDLRLLEEGSREIERAIIQTRKNRGEIDL